MLARVSELVNSSLDAYTIARKITEEAATSFGGCTASVSMTGERELKYVAGAGLPAPLIERMEEIGRGEMAARYLSGSTSPVIIGDARSDHRVSAVHELAASVGVVTVAWSPLVSDGNLLGTLTIYHGVARTYGEETLLALKTVANLLALTLAGVRRAEVQRFEDRAKDRFLNALSHELRTPLTSIMGYAQIIRKRLRGDSSDYTRIAEQIEVLWTQSQRLNCLIDTFVDLAYIDQGEFSIQAGRVDLVEVLQGVAAQALLLARAAPQVAVDAPTQPLWVHGDSKRLGQVFTHIISNAIRHSPQDAIVSVRCEVQDEEGKVVISITDHGPGIPANRVKNIFERFQHTDMPGTGGLGVGLYISKTIVEAHGGYMTLDSSPGKGTTVSIMLPL